METELATSVKRALSQMAAFHTGEELVRAAHVLIDRLPPGPLVLVSTTIEGAAIAAVMSALASTRDLSWHLISPSWRPDLPEGQVVVVEPVDAGLGWRSTMESLMPGAEILTPTA